MTPNPKRVRAMLGELPTLAAEVFLTWGHPNPSGQRNDSTRGSSTPRVPMDLTAWDALRPDEHGLLFELTQCVRLVTEEMRDEGEQWPDLANPPTWTGECAWLLGTEPWWGERLWRDDLDHAITRVWADLARAARTPPPLHLACPRAGCGWPVHPKAEGAYYQCEAGHIIDHHAEIRRMGQIQEMTSGELAEHMGVTKRTLRRWRESGALAPCGTRGREPVWSVLDVRRAAERFGR